MRVVFLSLQLIFELIQQAALVKFIFVFKHFQDLGNLILNILQEKLHISCLVSFVQTATISKAMIKFQSKFDVQILQYSITRDNRFLLSPSLSFQGKQETFPPAPLDTSATALVCIFSSILFILNNGGTKVEVKRDFKSYFLSPKINREAERLCMKCSSTSNTYVQRCLYPLFQNQHPHFLLLHFFQRMPQPKVWINKMVNQLHY